MQAAVDETGDWVAVSALAERYGVSRQAVSKRVGKFADKGQLPTRGTGRGLRVHLPTYAQLVAASHDPAQDLRNRHVKRSESFDDALPIDAPPQQPKFNDAAAREKNAKAQLAEMQLAQKRGELVPVREIEAAAIETGTKITQRLNALKAAAGKLYAAAKGGEEALHIELLAMVNATIVAVSEDMAQLAARGATDPE